MTFSRAKASWTDTIESVTAAQVETLDDNQSKMVDGAGGGDYSPSAPIQVNGSGIGSNALTDVTAKGVLQRAATGRLVRNTSLSLSAVGGAEILDIAGTQVLGMEFDTYYTDLDHGNNIVIHLAEVTGEWLPSAGDMIQVIRRGIPTLDRTFYIYTEGPAPVLLASFPRTALNPAAQIQSNNIYMAEFWYSGSAWVATRLSGDVL